MAKKEEVQKQTQEVQEQSQKQKYDRILYAGPTIINEKFFLRRGQIFTEIPRYVPEKLRKFFIPLADYSPEKEKELEKKAAEYLKTKKRGE